MRPLNRDREREVAMARRNGGAKGAYIAAEGGLLEGEQLGGELGQALGGHVGHGVRQRTPNGLEVFDEFGRLVVLDVSSRLGAGKRRHRQGDLAGSRIETM